MNKLSNEFIALAVSVVTAVLAFFVFDLGLIISPILTALAFGGTIFVTSGITPKDLIQQDNTRASVAGGTEKLNTIVKLRGLVRKASVVETITDLAGTIQKILTTVGENPTKLKQADQFLNYYLDTTIKIITLYIDLSRKNVHDIEILSSLARAEKTLFNLKDAFEKQLAKLLTSDAMDLDAELHLLEQTINMEGLGKTS